MVLVKDNWRMYIREWLSPLSVTEAMLEDVVTDLWEIARKHGAV